MSVMIADPSYGVWEARNGEAQLQERACGLDAPCMLCACGDWLAVADAEHRECVCLGLRGFRHLARMPSVPAPCGLLLSPCGRYLYQLSGEADCVHTRLVATGELLFATPTGVFPRMMRMDASGRLVLVAGGAVNEAYLLAVPELNRERTIYTRSPCFAADFWQDGLLLVCAGEGEDIQTVVYTLPPHAVRPREVIVLPGQPGGLCVCPDGRTALLSTRDGLMKLDIASGRLIWNLPEWPLCMRLCCRGTMALVSGTLNGEVCLLAHQKPWLKRILFRGSEPNACFLPEHGMISATLAHP